MKLSRTARTLLSVTALAWSIPFAQAADDRPDRDEPAAVEILRDRLAMGRTTLLADGLQREVADDAARDG